MRNARWVTPIILLCACVAWAAPKAMFDGDERICETLASTSTVSTIVPLP
jgi:hypothetical protein